MPVLLRGTLNHGIGSRATLPSRHSELLRPTASSENAGGQGGRRESIISKRTVLSVRDAQAKRQKRGFVPRLKRLYKRLHLNYLFPLAFMMLYMLIGAFLFNWLEGSTDRKKRLEEYENYVRERELLLKRMEEIYKDLAAVNVDRRRKFTEEAVDYFHSQIDVSFSSESDWSLTTAMYYSGTLFTTIGYGDVACNTVSGRIMTVVYAIVGIPLMLITLNDLGKFLYKSINGVVKLLGKRNLSFHSLSFKEPSGDEEKIVEREENPEENKEDTTNRSRGVNFQLSVEGSREDAVSIDIPDEEQVVIEPGPPPRMPVTVAIGITVGWIFFCAALFKLWEHEWTYAESCYFMFISLSTIGLGDVIVKRRDLMVLCFAFVIVGLSLVSMCINVIQSALEDLYIKLLMKMLLEYQNKLQQGDSSMGASLGMMKMWGGNKTAKYLMPLLSKDKRMTAMAKVQEDAVAKGIEIPPVFMDMDEKSGMPKILTIAEEQSSETFEEVLRQAEELERKSSVVSVPLPPTIVLYDCDTQTDNPLSSDKWEQTTMEETTETAVMTDMRNCDLVCSAQQYDAPSIADCEAQTVGVECVDEETLTTSTSCSTKETQTECVVTKEQELQTHLVDYLECEAQTEAAEYKSQRVQTPFPDYANTEAQTDEVKEPSKMSSRMSKAKDRLRKAFARGKELRRASGPMMTNWRDPCDVEEVDEDEEAVGSETESGESLDWDPIDGMHAERQRPVSDLKKLFDVQAKGESNTSSKKRNSH